MAMEQGGFVNAVKSSTEQLIKSLPAVVGVVMLIGLFNTFIQQEVISLIFTGDVALETFWGTCFGSIFAGNAINGYVIGAELFKNDVSLFAVTAFIIAWVTVGLVQLPAEITALGFRFALVRNALCFVLTAPMAILTVLISTLISGWLS